MHVDSWRFANGEGAKAARRAREGGGKRAGRGRAPQHERKTHPGGRGAAPRCRTWSLMGRSDRCCVRRLCAAPGVFARVGERARGGAQSDKGGTSMPRPLSRGVGWRVFSGARRVWRMENGQEGRITFVRAAQRGGRGFTSCVCGPLQIIPRRAPWICARRRSLLAFPPDARNGPVSLGKWTTNADSPVSRGVSARAQAGPRHPCRVCIICRAHERGPPKAPRRPTRRVDHILST